MVTLKLRTWRRRSQWNGVQWKGSKGVGEDRIPDRENSVGRGSESGKILKCWKNRRQINLLEHSKQWGV